MVSRLQGEFDHLDTPLTGRSATFAGPCRSGGEDFCVKQNIATSRVQIHAHVEPEVRAELLEIARANDRSIAAEVRTAIREHLKRELNNHTTKGDA